MKYFKIPKFNNILLFTIATIIFLLFAFISITKHKNFYTNHFDMSTMHQPTYNTYMAFRTQDFSRFLEMTDPHENQGQVKRLSFHFDLILVPISLLYFIYSGPETLLVVQAFALAFAIVPIAHIVKLIFDPKDVNTVTLIVIFTYSISFPVTNLLHHTFHPIALAPIVIFSMFYFALKEKYFFSILLFLVSLTLKENMALSGFGYGFSFLVYKFLLNKKLLRKEIFYSLFIMIFSLFWFYIVMVYLIPYFRTSDSYYMTFYSQYGESPSDLFRFFLFNPIIIFTHILSFETVRYFLITLLPFFFISLLNPIFLLAAGPEYLLNILSQNASMTSTKYQYEIILLPYIFISFLMGFKTVFEYFNANLKKVFISFLLLVSLISFYIYNIELKHYLRVTNVNTSQHETIRFWYKKLEDENIKVAATRQLTPELSSRRFLYLAPDVKDYRKAEYVLVLERDLYYYNPMNSPLYVLQNDLNYELVDENNGFYVFKKIL